MNAKPCLFLALPLSLLLSNCTHQGRSSRNAQIDLRHAQQSKYVLPAPETERFRSEALRAKRAGNREVCGTLLRSPEGSLALCFADNDSYEAHSFSISYESLWKMEAMANATNSNIIGSFHSHPSGIAEPGDEDLRREAVDNLMMIHSCLTGKTRLWRVASANGEREAIEIPLDVRARRSRGFSPLAPSRAEHGIALDVRSQK